MSGPLTRPEFAVLEAHRLKPPQSQRSLAKQTGLSLGYINQTLQRLRSLDFLTPEATISDAGWAAMEPYKVTNAIIMAAGMSTRFAPISYERPKGLLVVKGEVLIERQIRQLKEAGIDDITVVVGYRQEQFYYLEDQFGVHIVVCPEYRERNNNSALKAAEALFDNTYICSSDNYFTRNVFEPYVYEGYYAAVWQDGPSGDEWGITASPSGRIITAATGTSDTWVMMGHAYWDRSFSLRFRSILDAVYDRPETAPKLWEAIYADRVNELHLQLWPFPPGIIWEFDTPDDLRAFDPDFISNVDSAILDHICDTLDCQRDELSDFTPMLGGFTNTSFRFTCDGSDYVYRHPGVNTQDILDRKAESEAERIASDLGLDHTFIHQDPIDGWKIARWWEVSEPFDYHNKMHVRLALTAIRELHAQPRVIDRSFDLLDEVAMLMTRIAGSLGTEGSGRLSFGDFNDLLAKSRHLHDLVQADNLPKVLCHNDFFAPNILVSGDRLALIDWEFAGMSDPASDMGTFICCSDYTWDEAVDAVRVYFGHEPTNDELRHYIAYVSLASFYWWVWSLYKDACGESVGSWSYRWYRGAKEYGEAALALYEKKPAAKQAPEKGDATRASTMSDLPTSRSLVANKPR